MNYNVIIIPYGISEIIDPIREIAPTLLGISKTDAKQGSIILPATEEYSGHEDNEFWAGTDYCYHCGKGPSHNMFFHELEKELYRDGTNAIRPFCFSGNNKTLIVHSDDISENEQLLISRFQKLIDETVLISATKFSLLL